MANYFVAAQHVRAFSSSLHIPFLSVPLAEVFTLHGRCVVAMGLCPLSLPSRYDSPQDYDFTDEVIQTYVAQQIATRLNFCSNPSIQLFRGKEGFHYIIEAASFLKTELEEYDGSLHNALFYVLKP